MQTKEYHYIEYPPYSIRSNSLIGTIPRPLRSVEIINAWGAIMDICVLIPRRMMADTTFPGERSNAQISEHKKRELHRIAYGMKNAGKSWEHIATLLECTIARAKRLFRDERARIEYDAAINKHRNIVLAVFPNAGLQRGGIGYVVTDGQGTQFAYDQSAVIVWQKAALVATAYAKYQTQLAIVNNASAL